MVGTTAPAPSLWVKDGAKGRLPGGGFLLLGFDCSGSKPHSQGGTQSTYIVSLLLFSKQGNLQVLPRPHTGLALPFFFRFHEFLQSMLSQGTWGPELLQVSQIWFVALPWTQKICLYLCYPLGPHQNPRLQIPCPQSPWWSVSWIFFFRTDWLWLGWSWEGRVVGIHFETSTELLLNLKAFSLTGWLT